MTSVLHARFKTDTNKEEAGVWTNFGGADAEKGTVDAKIRIRRLKSRASQDARAELDKPFASEIRRGTLAKSVNEDLALKQIAKGVIAEWSGVTNAAGEEIPYTPENAYNLLKELPELADMVIQISADLDNFKVGIVEDSEKN